jgi:hypothetical protein
MAAVDKSLLERWRSLDAVDVVSALADYAKRDPSFVPIKSTTSERWHVSVCGRDFELLLTGPKFWDTRESAGGGGAVDLAMHLAGLRFKDAVRLLVERRI